MAPLYLIIIILIHHHAPPEHPELPYVPSFHPPKFSSWPSECQTSTIRVLDVDCPMVRVADVDQPMDAHVTRAVLSLFQPRKPEHTGTTNFVHGFPYTCTSINLVDQRIHVLGVNYNPFLEHLHRGVRSTVSFLHTLTHLHSSPAPTTNWGPAGPLARTTKCAAIALACACRGQVELGPQARTNTS